MMGGIALVQPAGPTRADIVSIDGFTLYGDFRLRLEHDFDSQRADGTDRDDRTRARIRARLGIDYRATDHVSAGVRLRSGSDASQQSPHITILDFDDNDTGDSDFNLDRWFLKAQTRRLWGWAGRDGFPFWKQNEMFWDDDATVAGLAAGFDALDRERDRITLHAAWLTLPVGMRDFAGTMAAGQVVYSHSGGPWGFTLAAGLFDSMAADPDDDADAAILLNGNGLRDYRIWSASAQAKLEADGRSLVLGADYYRNDQDYSDTDPDPFTAANHDETDGFVASVSYGEVKERGDWQVAVYHARIETLAVIASYAQDDWVRWGTPTENTSSDLEGQEVRFVYGLADRLQVMGRLYLVEAITSRQDGKRLRIDFNYRF